MDLIHFIGINAVAAWYSYHLILTEYSLKLKLKYG